MAVIVMGVSGSGKSTLGALIASELDCPFLEGDDYHAAAAVEKMRRGEALGDGDRWPWLDRLGRALRERTDDNGWAVATCSALKRAYRERLLARCDGRLRFVLLDSDRDVLAQRLAARRGHYMPVSLLDSQLGTLERPQSDERALTLRSDQSPERLCATAMAWLHEKG